MAANTSVKGRILVAGASAQAMQNLVVEAVDIDPLSGDDSLGKVTPKPDGSFTISYSPGTYRPWFIVPEGAPDIELRVYGDGGRLLYERRKVDGVSVAELDVGTIEIHPSNLPVEDSASEQQKKDDPYWLVTHTTLDSTSGVPVRLTRGNQIEWLIDGDPMFPNLTDSIATAARSIHFLNSMFYVKGLKSKFDFPSGKNHETVGPNDEVKVHRLEKIMRDQAAQNREVRVLTWDLRRNALDFADQADEVAEFFGPTQVLTDVFESTQLLHMKAAVIDGTLAYVLGSTMNQGYFGDTKHLIRDARHGTATIMHDAGLSVRGPAVRFVDQTFATIWNVPPNEVEVTPAPQQPPVGDDQAAIATQVLRTLPGKVFTQSTTGPNIEQLPHGETGILEAYQRAITKAEHFVYIEDQYFSSDEIVKALKLRMRQKTKLELIVILNLKPDIPGYHRNQTAHIKALRKEFGEDRVGVFTMWSTDAKQTPFEIAPIYAHAKLGIVDDLWATVGSANLDGASLNQRQWGMIACGLLREFSISDFVRKHKVVTLVLVGLLVLPFLPVVGPAFLSLELSGSLGILLLQLPFIISALAKETVRKTEHATPSRDDQPPRHPELNVVVYNGIAGQPATSAVKDLREALWTEQLGAAPPSPPPDGGCVKLFSDAAEAHLAELKKVAKGLTPLPTPMKILKWSPESKPYAYLKSLGVELQHKKIKILEGGVKLPFIEKDAQQ